MRTDNDPIRDQVRDRAAELGITAYRLSKESGISQRMIREYFAGRKRLTTALLVKLLPVVGLSVRLSESA
jgi:transcriptional regulator with XRE-family HTH domain